MFGHCVSTPYLMTGILAECCNDRMLSDSVMEKKGGISGYINIEKAVLYRKNKRDKTGTHMQAECSQPHLFYYILYVQ